MWRRPEIIRFCLALPLLVFAACASVEEHPASPSTNVQPAAQVDPAVLSAINAVEPFFKPMGKPKPYEWLGAYNEPGQTFDEYLASEPTMPTAERQKLYVLPLGKFTSAQKRVIDAAAEYLATFYDLPVGKLPGQPLNATYPNIRLNDFTHTRQVKTGYILNDLLPKSLPKDAAALIAFTDQDLYPDDTMNYVFGQASLEGRVGVWSLFRLEKAASYDTFLRRTLKIAAHETGHMFSMRHCTKYECVMSGTNQLAETDSRPIDACPQCMAKICWLSKVLPSARYTALATFCRGHGLEKEAAEFVKKAAAS